jgi:pimeloyl-ACP methyl ester carboxylesterase
MPTVETNGVETYYERHGDGPPVVLIHGGGWDHRSWAGQIESLADDHEVVVYDVRGHGRTGGSDREQYTIDLYAADLKALIDALELDRPAVVGLSLGGMIAHTYAATYPEDVSALVAVEAMVSFDLGPVDRVIASAMEYVLRVVGPGRTSRVRRFIAKLRGNLDEEEGTRQMPGLELTVEEYMDEVDEQMTTAEALKLSDAVRTLDGDPGAIEAPTLVVTGEDPHEAVAAGRDAMVEAVDDVRTRAVEGAGHGVNLEEPEVFDEAVAAFLAEVLERPATE